MVNMVDLLMIQTGNSARDCSLSSILTWRYLTQLKILGVPITTDHLPLLVQLSYTSMSTECHMCKME